jgi:type IV pilus biogenesis protein CpaD/CtpE
MNLKMLNNLPVTSIILTSALLVGLNGCRSTAQLIPESVIVRDTVIVTKERTLTDTLLLYKDTTIYQDRVKLKLDFIDRFVKVKVDCPSDTVRINTIKIVSQKEPLQKKNQFTESTKSLSVLFIIIFAGLLIINLAKRLS